MKVETKHQGVSQAKERRTAFDIETMDGHATLGSILHELGNQRTTIPLNSLSRSARTVLQRVIYRSEIEVNHSRNDLGWEILEKITIQHLRDARNIGNARANEFLDELNSLIAQINTPRPPCTDLPIEPVQPVYGVIQFEYLNTERMKALFGQMHEEERAGSILYASAQPLVVACAKHYSGKGISFKELIDQGNRGLLMALKKYDPESPHSFTAYASWWIRQAMLLLLEENTVEESLDASEIAQAIAQNTNSVGDFLSQVVTLLNFSTSKEINLFALRFGLIDGVPKSLDELGLIFGETRERIRQIESKFISKILIRLKGDPCPSCGETKIAGSHATLLQRIPAAFEIVDLISQCHSYSEYLEKLVNQESDVIINPRQLSIILRILLQEELAEKVELTFSTWER